MKQHNNNNSKLGGCATTNGLNIHNVHLSSAVGHHRHDKHVASLPGSLHTMPHSPGPACAGNGASNGNTTISANTNGQQPNNAMRKNSKPTLFGAHSAHSVQRQTSASGQSSDTGSEKVVTSTASQLHQQTPAVTPAPVTSYVQNTPNVHLYEMQA